jgi:hypothetical protein
MAESVQKSGGCWLSCLRLRLGLLKGVNEEDEVVAIRVCKCLDYDILQEASVPPCKQYSASTSRVRRGEVDGDLSAASGRCDRYICGMGWLCVFSRVTDLPSRVPERVYNGMVVIMRL